MKDLVWLGSHVDKIDLLEAVDKSTDMILICGLFGDGEDNRTLCINPGLVLLSLLFLPSHSLCECVNKSQ